MPDMTEAQAKPTLAELRTPGLTGDNWEKAEAYCPKCGCMKSGDADTPNIGHDGCSDYGCQCHNDVLTR